MMEALHLKDRKMPNELQQQYDTLKDARLALIRKVRSLVQGLLNHKLGPDHWSILEDFQHLVLAELSTALEVGAALDSEEKNPDMLEMVLQVLDQDVVVNVPNPAMLPDGDATREGLNQDRFYGLQAYHNILIVVFQTGAVIEIISSFLIFFNLFRCILNRRLNRQNACSPGGGRDLVAPPVKSGEDSGLRRNDNLRY